MFLGGFLPGMVPLWCSLSPNRLRFITVFGAGLLIGTALIVVVPEGINLWYVSAAAEAAAASAAAATLRTVEQAYEREEGHGGVDHDHDHDHDHGHEHGGHWQIGCALALGFVLMIVVDRMGGSHGHSHGGSGPVLPLDRKELEKPEDGVVVVVDPSSKAVSVTLGLLIHAAVDGVALGSASLTHDGSLSMLVFFAILLHKGPAAFGLSSTLLHQGLQKQSGASLGRASRVVVACGAGVVSLSLSLSLSLSCHRCRCVVGDVSPVHRALVAQFDGRCSGSPWLRRSAQSSHSLHWARAAS
jgi:zinc transporter 9